jgi:hypothetical protein
MNTSRQSDLATGPELEQVSYPKYSTLYLGQLEIRMSIQLTHNTVMSAKVEVRGKFRPTQAFSRQI